jgi:hypothetical protein
VLSVRHALDHLIQAHFPAQYPPWQLPVEQVLHSALVTEIAESEPRTHMGYGTFGPESG